MQTHIPRHKSPMPGFDNRLRVCYKFVTNPHTDVSVAYLRFDRRESRFALRVTSQQTLTPRKEAHDIRHRSACRGAVRAIPRRRWAGPTPTACAYHRFPDDVGNPRCHDGGDRGRRSASRCARGQSHDRRWLCGAFIGTRSDSLASAATVTLTRQGHSGCAAAGDRAARARRRWA
jgi:hypothetical protein